MRATVGWRHLAEHRHRDRLLFYWFRELAKDEAPGPDEVAGAFAAGRGTKDEDDLWHVLTRAWDPAFEQALVERIVEGHPEPLARVAALTCLVERSAGQLPAICQELADKGREDRLVELAIELGELRHQRSDADGARHGEAAAEAAAGLPQFPREISEAALALKTKTTPTLSDDAHQLLASIPAPSEEVRLFRVSLDEHQSMFVPEDVRWLLAKSEQASNAVEAIDGAIRHGMAEEIQAGLSHRFAAVVARSLKAIATPMVPPLPNHLLTLARHKGSPVRRALVELLHAKQHPEHLPQLLLLAKDNWSPQSVYYGQEDVYPIARTAIAAIAKLSSIEDGAAEELYRVAINSRNSDVRYKVFVLLVRATAPRFQGQLFELAVNPGRRIVRQTAAQALIVGYEHVAPEIVARITPQLLGTRIEGVASRLLLLVALRGEIGHIVKVAEALSTNEKRRVPAASRDLDSSRAGRVGR